MAESNIPIRRGDSLMFDDQSARQASLAGPGRGNLEETFHQSHVGPGLARPPQSIFSSGSSDVARLGISTQSGALSSDWSRL